MRAVPINGLRQDDARILDAVVDDDRTLRSNTPDNEIPRDSFGDGNQSSHRPEHQSLDPDQRPKFGNGRLFAMDGRYDRNPRRERGESDSRGRLVAMNVNQLRSHLSQQLCYREEIPCPESPLHRYIPNPNPKSLQHPANRAGFTLPYSETQ